VTEVDNVGSAFSDKVVLVTGASSGIGATIAAAFAAQGAQIAANYPSQDATHHKAAIEQWRTEASLDADQVVPLEADVSDAAAVNAMYQQIKERWAKLDVLVNNAGINRDSTVAKMDDEQWRDVLAVNLDGAFYNCRAATGLLTEGGRIINIASIVAHTGNFGVANYAASKAGILGLTRSLALELAKRQITVNAVCPGFVDTGMTLQMPKEVLEKIIKQIPLGRRGRADEVADCILFLASTEASYITGQALVVNGGHFMGS
jgi:NAD(P)-dependent dehydrogenase (short-subunit alcohol dehydrogenase family)